MCKKTILLTVDLEDWFQVENFKRYINFSDWDACEWRFEANTHKLLKLFSDHGVKVTFFILGWNAERVPQLVREIKAEGHEIASHGNNHDLCSSMGLMDLNHDLRYSKSLLEDISGSEVIGYRAPSFSISEAVLNSLKDIGYRYDASYDSSGLNARHGKLEMNNYVKKGLAYIDSSGFFEFPVSNICVGNKVLPWGGGGYFRFWPTWLFNIGVRKIMGRDGGYVFYTHPWEYDPCQPKVIQAARLDKFRHYLNLESCFERLDVFLKVFRDSAFMTMSDYLKSPAMHR